MEVQRLLPVRLGRFLGYLAFGLVSIVLFAAFLDMDMPLWFPNFPSAVAGACFFAIGGVFVFLGGHIYGSFAGMWAEEGSLPVSGMLAMRAAGEDKLNDIEEQDWLKVNAPSRQRVLTLVALALIFLTLSVVAATVPGGWIVVIGAAIVVVGMSLLDRGVRWTASR